LSAVTLIECLKKLKTREKDGTIERQNENIDGIIMMKL
jgi:hypothetical protein